MHALIASPFLDEYLVVRPGRLEGLRIPRAAFRHLGDVARSGGPVPMWLADGARRAWGLDLDGLPVADTVLVRAESSYEFARASYELNLGCNYDCEHCYLGLNPSRRRPASFSASAARSRVATLGTRSSTSIHSETHRSARSGATPTSP